VARGVTVKISDSVLRNVDVSFQVTTSVGTSLTGKVLVHFEFSIRANMQFLRNDILN
jgi:hypothetical protein